MGKTQKEIKIEMAWQEFEPYVERAVARLGRDVALKGFRPGKAPREILYKHLSREKVLLEAADRAVKEKYFDVVKEQKLEVIGLPRVEVLKLAEGNPFSFKIKIEILPAIELPDYKKIALSFKRAEVKIDDKEVEEALKYLRESRAKIRKDENGGKDKAKAEPPLDDDFARSVGNFKNLAELKQSIKNGILSDKQRAATLSWRGKVLDEIERRIKLELPPNLLLLEKERLMHNLKDSVARELKIDFAEYLKSIKKTEEQLEKDIEKAAKKQVSRFLILKEIGRRENIKVEDKEI